MVRHLQMPMASPSHLLKLVDLDFTQSITLRATLSLLGARVKKAAHPSSRTLCRLTATPLLLSVAQHHPKPRIKINRLLLMRASIPASSSRPQAVQICSPLVNDAPPARTSLHPSVPRLRKARRMQRVISATMSLLDFVNLIYITHSPTPGTFFDMNITRPITFFSPRATSAFCRSFDLRQGPPDPVVGQTSCKIDESRFPCLPEFIYVFRILWIVACTIHIYCSQSSNKQAVV